MDPDVVQEIIERDRGVCLFCGSDDRTQVAHVRSRGARPDLVNEPTNLALLCFQCHMESQHQQGTLTSADLEALLAKRHGFVYTGDTGALSPKYDRRGP
jgi:5-methylcytosine-specific restriction endonuclease McrA